MTERRSPAKLLVRTACAEDIDEIIALHARVYPDQGDYTRGMIQGQLSRYPEGQFVVERESGIVGHAATFRIDEAAALGPHTWDTISGSGYASRHDPKGDWLYGMEVAVDRAERRQRIGERLYDARKRLCEESDLKGIVFGGRLPGYARRRKVYATPEAYLQAVIDKEIRDPVAAFQVRQGFEPIGILHGYAPSDTESAGVAAHMIWRNPYYEPALDAAPASRRDPETVRVASVQFQQRAISDVDEFFRNVEYFVDVVADYRADFVVFPEMLTLQLLACEERKSSPEEAIEALSRHTPRFVSEMRAMALRRCGRSSSPLSSRTGKCRRLRGTVLPSASFWPPSSMNRNALSGRSLMNARVHSALSTEASGAVGLGLSPRVSWPSQGSSSSALPTRS